LPCARIHQRIKSWFIGKEQQIKDSKAQSVWKENQIKVPKHQGLRKSSFAREGGLFVLFVGSVLHWYCGNTFWAGIGVGESKVGWMNKIIGLCVSFFLKFGGVQWSL